jgi:arsenate reductase (thioredoxin)
MPQPSRRPGRIDAMAHVLFVCVQNAGRSQMAEELFRSAAGEHHQARSAGTAPAAHAHPEVVALMPQLAGREPHKLEREDAEWADIVVTMGCDDECPYIPGKRYVDWELEDPAGKDAETVGRIRDEIDRRITLLLDELAVAA